MKLVLPAGVLLVTLTVAAAATAAWVSVADAPWEGKEGDTALLCQDALERRQAVKEALQRRVAPRGPGSVEVPLTFYRGNENLWGKEVERLDSDLLAIERDIQKFCE